MSKAPFCAGNCTHQKCPTPYSCGVYLLEETPIEFAQPDPEPDDTPLISRAACFVAGMVVTFLLIQLGIYL